MSDEDQAKFRNDACEDIAELYDGNIETAMEDAQAIGATKIRLGFTVEIDFGRVPQKLKTRMAFSKPVSDEREREYADPNQLGLPLGDVTVEVRTGEEEEKEEIPERLDTGEPEQKKRGRGRPKKKAD